MGSLGWGGRVGEAGIDDAPGRQLGNPQTPGPGLLQPPVLNSPPVAKAHACHWHLLSVLGVTTW